MQHVEAVKIAHASSELATKADIKELEYKIQLAIEKSQNKMLLWIGTIAIVGAGFVAWLFEFHGKI